MRGALRGDALCGRGRCGSVAGGPDGWKGKGSNKTAASVAQSLGHLKEVCHVLLGGALQGRAAGPSTSAGDSFLPLQSAAASDLVAQRAGLPRLPWHAALPPASVECAQQRTAYRASTHLHDSVS